ncbi:hypothetical protein FRC04_004680 [Tulasnella sp. 424]|nr:hypothetical protein FRC04_004680 [Tulasnella sp. 424]
MTTPAFDIYNPGVKFEVPVPPKEFGQDGGKFYRCYDALAEEIDDDMVNGLKEQLEGLLIFAGLFAGVNTAFLALTLPLMSSNPADDTNALLRENNAILLQLALGRNDSLPSAQALPSETFSPAGKVLTVNVLFSVSLTLALISSFLAVLGRQWLVYYRKRSGGGPERQRWEQLKRFLGAKRWGLEWVLDDFLPSVLQVGLIIFCISLTIYLSILHPTLSNVVGTLICVGLAIFIITGLLAIWDKFCPFQSTLSHLISRSIALAARLAARLARARLNVHRLASADARKRVFSRLLAVFLLALIVPLELLVLVQRLLMVLRDCFVGESEVSWEDLWEDMIIVDIIAWLLQTPVSFVVRLAAQVQTSKSQEKDPGELHILAIKRVMCISDDALTQLHGVSNILAMSDPHHLDILAADDEFTARLSELWRSSYSRTLQLRGHDQLELATAIQCLYRAALAHVLLSSSKGWWKPHYNLLCPSDEGPEEQRMLPPSDLVQNVHSNMVNAYLGCITFDWALGYRKLPGVDSLPPPSSVDVLLNPSWSRISIILEVIVTQPTGNSGAASSSPFAISELRNAYAGNLFVVFANLERAIERSRSRAFTRESRDILKQYLVPIFKFAGKAAVDSAEIQGIGTYPVARLLRLSETWMRAEDSPSNFTSIGRSLRRELISVLVKARERRDLYYQDDPYRGTLDQLIRLFANFTGPSMSPTIFSNEDDLDLVSLFSPILQHLQAVTQDPGWVELEYEHSVSEVTQLDGVFKKFKAAVERVSRNIKRQDRDPELGKWCYWRDENLNVMAY